MLTEGMETLSFVAEAPPVLLTIPEVAALLRCTRRTVERQIACRRLSVLKLGRAVRIERAELDRFIDSLRDHAG